MTLVACSHGTASEEGRAVVRELVERIADLVPGTAVAQAFVDVEQPEVADVVADSVADGPVVVVPLLLSTGFHTEVDIAGSVKPYALAARAPALGPHPLLVDVLRDRIAETLGEELRAGDHVVLAAAGSSNPKAVVDVEGLVELLEAALPVPVSAGYAAGATPTIAEAVAAARAGGAQRVIAASYVLAPGYFAGLVHRAGADVVTPPLGADARIAEIAAERFRDALATLPV
jgi:sirohydrochlorin ferrochelatase